MSQGTGGGDRLRVSPSERFAGDEHLVDLGAVTEQIHAEHPAARGHRQMVVCKRGGVTVSLFSFEAGGGLGEHKADGVVSILGLDGRVVVTTPGGERTLTRERLLVLDPNVPHSVRAEEASRVLVSVVLGAGV